MYGSIVSHLACISEALSELKPFEEAGIMQKSENKVSWRGRKERRELGEIRPSLVSTILLDVD